jgi:nucleoside-diphosphate-sugar epimerase
MAEGIMNNPASGDEPHGRGGANRLQRVAVTGATGLLGGSVVRELLSRGVDVVAVVRDRDRARQVLGENDRLHLVVGDVLNAEALMPALHGADAVIHTAAYFREYYQPGFDPALLERTNVTAVAQLVAAAGRAEVPVFVQVSSSGTVGPTPPGELADEDTPPGKSVRRNHYYASKVRVERLVDALRDEHSLRIPVVVPGWMWGPGDTAPSASGQMFLSIASAASAGVPRVSTHIVDARDVAHACVAAAEDGYNRRYLVAGDRHELPAVCAQIAQLCGVPAPRVVAPRVALAASGMVQLADRLRGRPPLVTPRGTRVLIAGDRQHISSARAQTELGVTFRPITDTLTDEAQWFRRHGRLRPLKSTPQLAEPHIAVEETR